MRITYPLRLRYKPLLFVNLVLVISLAILLFWVKPQYEENAHLLKLIMYDCTGLMKNFYHFNDLVFWQPLLQWLYAANYNVPWFPILVIGLTFFSLVVVFNSILVVGTKKNIPEWVSISILLLLFFILSDNLYWIEPDRVAFIVSGLALVFFTLIPDLLDGRKRRLTAYLFASIWYVGGICLRPEIGTVIFIAFAPGICLLFYPKPFRALKVFLPIIVIVVCFALAYGYLVVFSNDYYYKTEPDIEYELLDRRNIVPLSDMTSGEDSAKYLAVTQYWMLGDVDRTTVEFVRKTIDKNNTWFDRLLFFLRPVEHKDKRLINLEGWVDMMLTKPIYALYILFLCLLLFYTRGIQIALFTGLSFVVLTIFVSLSFTINSFARITDPMLGLGCVLHTVVLYKQRGWEKPPLNNSLIPILSIIAILALFSQKLFHFKAETRYLSIKQTSIRKTLQQACESTDRKYVVIFLDQVCLNTGDALQVFDVFNGKTLLLPDFAQFSANSYFLSTTQRRTNCEATDFLCRMKFIQDHANESIIIGAKDRLDFFKYYMQNVYKYKFDVTQSPHIWLDYTTYIWLPSK